MRASGSDDPRSRCNPAKASGWFRFAEFRDSGIASPARSDLSRRGLPGHRSCRVLSHLPGQPARARSAASVLALPTHSIYSSQTQPGDQLVLCIADEMERRLERLHRLAAESSAPIQAQFAAAEKPALERRARRARTGRQRSERDQTRPSSPMRWASSSPHADLKPPKQLARTLVVARSAQGPARTVSGPGRLLLDRRRAPGTQRQGYQLHRPLHVTEERWYPGTLVLMTLQRTDLGEEMAENPSLSTPAPSAGEMTASASSL